MKLKDFTGFSDFLTVLFDFLKENDIPPRLYPVEDMDALRLDILDSDFIEFRHYEYDYDCGIDFHYAGTLHEWDVHMFIFGNDTGERNSHILFDLTQRQGISFINFAIDTKRKLPFVSDFWVDDADCMGMDEFREFLARNRRPKDLAWVEVE